MTKISSTVSDFESGKIDKPTYVQTMHEVHHSKLFDYAAYLKNTNIKKIEITDDSVIMTSRDRGVRIACSHDDHRIVPVETLNFFDYEKSDSTMLENLITDGDHFFDIGANLGWYSINIGISRRACKIHCFEPIPKTYAQLTRNIQLNSALNITTHNFGFSDRAGEFTFFYYPEGSGNASAVNLTGRDDVESVQCHVRTLDEFVEATGETIDFIKCDVEGAELMVFKGGVNSITANLPIIFAEILRKWSYKFGYDPNEIFELLRGLGYQAFIAKDNRLHSFERMDDATIETNFFFLHNEKHSAAIARYLA
jgi:FkbM family methyltransferase